MKVVGVIPARYDSSRFPGKPLADICGKPMIWWVYQQCLKVPELAEIYVATDDKRIETVCQREGLNVIMTSRTHNTGTDRVGEVSEKVNGDLFINIQGDEPLIDPEEIQELVHVFNDDGIYFASLRTKINDRKLIESKSTVKVVVDKNENALFFSRSVIPSDTGRTSEIRIFKHVGIYAYKRDFLKKFVALPQTELEICEGIEPIRALENGYTIRVKETEYSSIGVDYPEHIKIVEEEIRKRNTLDLSRVVLDGGSKVQIVQSTQKANCPTGGGYSI